VVVVVVVVMMMMMMMIMMMTTTTTSIRSFDSEILGEIHSEKDLSLYKNLALGR
jgi:short subunit fatty acids transporter